MISNSPKPCLKIGVITLFPQMFEAMKHGVVNRAIDNQLLRLELINLRAYSLNKHGYIDDRPFGGGPGMVLQYAPLKRAILAAKEMLGDTTKVIYLSPQGKPLKQSMVSEAAKCPCALLLICGRYEGIDERIIDQYVDEEWSIGDMVLTGGEIPAMAAIDALIRLVPGVLNDERSAQQDSFSDGLLDTPHYTRPEEIDGLRVPKVLLQGHHQAIERWRMKQRLGKTWSKRPDLLQQKTLSSVEQNLLDEYIKGATDVKNH